MKIGRTLRKLRLTKDISTIEMSRLTGFNRGTIYKLENDIGNPTLESLEKYAKSLELPLSEVIAIAEKENNKEKIKYMTWGYVAEDKRLK